MNHKTTPNATSRPRFKVLHGLRLEAHLFEAKITARLSIDEALSLAMILLYEVREQAARQQAQGGAAQ